MQQGTMAAAAAQLGEDGGVELKGGQQLWGQRAEVQKFKQIRFFFF